MPLNRDTSSEIVGELAQNFKPKRLLEILGVDDRRYKALLTGRGCLKDSQLQRITDQTGRAWMRWAVDAIARHPQSQANRKLDAATQQLLNEIDPAGKDSTKSRKSKVIPQRARKLQHA